MAESFEQSFRRRMAEQMEGLCEGTGTEVGKDVGGPRARCSVCGKDAPVRREAKHTYFLSHRAGRS